MNVYSTLHTASRFSFAAAGLLALLSFSACTPMSSHGADDYFEGQALRLAVASEIGDSDTITRLVKEEGVDPDKTFARRDGIPVLAWPLRARSLEGLQAMLEAGADPNARESKHMNGEMIHFNNAMVYAAKMDDPRYLELLPRYLELLLDHGGDPNTRTENNETLLYQAFISGNQWKNVKLLINRGARINETIRGSADTVLSWYTGRGGFMHAYWLLENGADPTLLMTAPKGSGQADRMIMVEDIYWEITSPELLPWQKKCQEWLVQRNIPRPPMPGNILKKRAAFGYPTDEKDVPLP